MSMHVPAVVFLLICIVPGLLAGCNFDQNFMPVSAARGCYQASHPWDQNTADKLLSALQNLSMFYVLRDSAIFPPPSQVGSYHVNVLAELQQIALMQFDNMWDLYMKIVNVYLGLHDAHTAHYLVFNCTAGVTVIQPFWLGSRVDSMRNQEIYIRQTWQSSLFHNLTGIVASDYLNYTVESINDIPALEFLNNFMQQFGYLSKDPNSAFNSIIGPALENRVNDTVVQGFWPITFTSSRVILTDLPPTDVLEYSLLSPTGNRVSLTVPYLLYQPSQPSLAINLTTCAPPTPSEAEELTNDMRARFGNGPTLDVDLFESRDVQQLPATSGQLRYWLVGDDTLAITVPSFEFNATEYVILDQWIDYAANQSLQYLIVDLTSNGGGDICLGYELQNRLMHDKVTGLYDLIHSPAADELAVKTAMNVSCDPESPVCPHFWLSANGTQWNTTDAWYSPGATYVRGGVADRYSLKNRFQCQLSNASVVHRFKKVVLVSDGLCGSTCAVFSSHLIESDSADSFVFGGFTGMPQHSFFSFPGGEVAQDADIVQMFQQANMSADAITLPPGHIQRMAYLEIYGWSKKDPYNVPLEYVFKPAHKVLKRWSFANETELYTYVRSHLK